MKLPFYNMFSPTTVFYEYDVNYALLEPHWTSKVIKICALLNFLTMVDFLLFLFWYVEPLLGNESVNTFPRQRIIRKQSDNFSRYKTAM
jgi:hypothetical protein